MTDFRSMSRGGNRGGENQSNTDNQSGGLDQSAANNVNSYMSRSNDDLLNELFLRVQSGKTSGTLNNQDLDQFLNTVSGMLSGEQYEKMRSMIENLKRL